jgi:putative peptidoglycan lipid II flippase
MSGGLYRSAHAARDGDRPPLDGATLISADPGGSAGFEMLPGADTPTPALPHSHDAHAEGGGPGGPTDGGPDAAAGDSGGGSTVGNSAIMAAGSLVSRVIGFVRNALIGMTLGGAAGSVGDAYTTAQFLPSQIYELLLGGVLSSVLIPMMVRRRKADADGGQAYTQKLLTVAVVGLGVATLLAVACAPIFTLIQAGGKGEEYRGLVTVLSRLILPMIFFIGMSGLMGAVLNVRGHFAAPMWAPILNNIVVISACGVFLGHFGTAGGLAPGQMTSGRIVLIGGATLLGLVAQGAGLLPALRKVGFAWAWRWDPRSLGLREIGGLAGWMLCYVAANQVAFFLVVKLLNSGATSETKAGVTIFNNVFLLIMMAHGIIGVSVMTALMPRMSAAAAEGRYADIAADLTGGIRMTSTALAPIAVVYGVLATPISVALFQGAGFSPASAAATGGVLLVGAFAVLPLSISQLCTYVFYSLQGNRTAALINLPVVAVRIAAQLTLFYLLADSLTAAGLTAGNAISYVVSAAISLVVLRRQIGRLGLRPVAISLAKVLAAAGVAAVVGVLVVKLLPGGALPGKVQAFVQVIVGGIVIMATYLGAAALLRVQEIGQVIGMVRRKIGR